MQTQTNGRGGAVVAVLGALVAAGWLAPIAVPAADAEEVKIGSINLMKVFDNYERTKQSDAQLSEQGKRKEAELEARVKEVQKLRDSLELLSEEARDVRARELEEQVDNLKRFRSQTARDLGRQRDKVATAILDDIQAAVNEFASANGFSLILDSRSLFYSQSAYDVTDEILAILNSRGMKTSQR